MRPKAHSFRLNPGMIGFVKTGATSGGQFKDRLTGEEEILAKAKARKAARAGGKK